jgi:hypothetical protein
MPATADSGISVRPIARRNATARIGTGYHNRAASLLE